jgi:hypothetical protein
MNPKSAGLLTAKRSVTNTEIAGSSATFPEQQRSERWDPPRFRRRNPKIPPGIVSQGTLKKLCVSRSSPSLNDGGEPQQEPARIPRPSHDQIKKTSSDLHTRIKRRKRETLEMDSEGHRKASIGRQKENPLDGYGVYSTAQRPDGAAKP